VNRTFGVIGLGSMGKRRVRDLLALGHSVIGFDTREDRRAEAVSRNGIPVVADFDALLDAGVEAFVISTPPDVHVEYYERCFAAERGFFSEANIFTPRASWFTAREAASGVRGFPSATWRHHPICERLRDRVLLQPSRAVRSIAHSYGGFLPSWHPWERYEDFYAGQWRTSAAREMVPFEMELLCWIFGPVNAVSATRARRADWVTPIDDTYFLLLEFASGVQGTLSIELHQVNTFRLSRVSMDGCGLTLDLARHELDEFDEVENLNGRHRAEEIATLPSFNFEDVYLAEIAAFAAQIDGTGTYAKTWAEDRHLSNVLWAAEESARRKEWVGLAEAEAAYDGVSWVNESAPDRGLR
jgi:predicted dehydrogenase